MKTITTTSTTIEINCASLSFYYYNDIGTLTINEADNNDQSNTNIEIRIKKEDLIDLFDRMKEEMRRELHL